MQKWQFHMISDQWWCQRIKRENNDFHISQVQIYTIRCHFDCSVWKVILYPRKILHEELKLFPPLVQCVIWTKILTTQQDRLLIKVTHLVLLGQQILPWRPITLASNLTCPQDRLLKPYPVLHKMSQWLDWSTGYFWHAALVPSRLLVTF